MPNDRLWSTILYIKQKLHGFTCGPRGSFLTYLGPKQAQSLISALIKRHCANYESWPLHLIPVSKYLQVKIIPKDCLNSLRMLLNPLCPKFKIDLALLFCHVTRPWNFGLRTIYSFSYLNILSYTYKYNGLILLILSSTWYKFTQ